MAIIWRNHLKKEILPQCVIYVYVEKSLKILNVCASTVLNKICNQNLQSKFAYDYSRIFFLLFVLVATDVAKNYFRNTALLP